MNKRERVNRVIKREKVDFLPSQITFADRTKDDAILEALGISDMSLDDYLENHLILSLTKADYPLFFRNDVELMQELEAAEEQAEYKFLAGILNSLVLQKVKLKL